MPMALIGALMAAQFVTFPTPKSSGFPRLWPFALGFFAVQTPMTDNRRKEQNLKAVVGSSSCILPLGHQVDCVGSSNLIQSFFILFF
jgi:hypothetical protein